MPTSVTYAKSLTHVRNHARQFYDNFWTLHHNFYILVRISGVTYCTLREVIKNAFNPGQNIVDKVLNLIKYAFIWNVLDLLILQVCGAIVKALNFGGQLAPVINSRIFLKFPKILTFKTFANSCGNSYNLSLVPFYFWWTIPKCDRVSKYFF